MKAPPITLPKCLHINNLNGSPKLACLLKYQPAAYPEMQKLTKLILMYMQVLRKQDPK